MGNDAKFKFIIFPIKYTFIIKLVTVDKHSVATLIYTRVSFS